MLNEHSDHQGTTPPLPEIAGFRLLRVINHGGMSTVYLAEQLALSREVAVKVMQPQTLADEVSRRRFENEVRTIARLEHPHIVRIHELGRTRGGLPYYTMPYLARGHLGQRDFSHDEARVIEVTQALYSALEYAHSRGVVHRDVKAENVLFDDAERPLLADFGIALRRGFGPRVTAAGLAVGSTAYMAPEQARGEDVDGRADLYSLAVLIWEMLSGGLPFQAKDALSMAVMHAQNPIPKLPPRLRHWQRFMNRALTKQPSQRFQDVAQMREAMTHIRPRREWPWLTWLRARPEVAHKTLRLRMVTLSIAALALIGLAYAVVGSRHGEFFRVDQTPEPTSAPASNDPTEAMLQPLPEAPLQAMLDAARQQIAQRQLIAPANANAYATVLEAWNTDSTNLQVGKAIDQLTAATTEELLRNLRDGNLARASDYFHRASALGQQSGHADSPAQQAMREQTAVAMQAAMDQAVKKYDREGAQKLAAAASDLPLPKPLLLQLAKQAKAIPKEGDAVAGDASRGVLQKNSHGAFVISRTPVSVGEYQRFATLHARAPALCRERGSLLRVLSPREWKSPGFRQTDVDPVVCVSMADAESYARWLSQETGHHYRLPSAAESEETAAEFTGRQMSLWLRDCATNCLQRQVSGGSWRSKQGQGPLLSSRGYDDVGFRLVREP